MSDLISRQAANDIADDLRDCISVAGYWAWTERIRKLPSAQPELVWCKDCEHWYTEEDEDDEYGHCRNHEFWTCGIWFCADGERREECGK